MVRSLNSAISGMQQFQERLDVIGNNISNVNTTGYKGARVDFADSFSQTMRQSSPSTGTTSGVASMQVGTGVTTAAVRNLYTQGALARTGLATDLAISGEGYFVVKEASAGGNTFVTRAGDFSIDDQGYLVTGKGLRVQGLVAGASGDIRLEDPTAGGPAVTSFNVDRSGNLNVVLADATQTTRGQITLQKFSNPQALVKEGNNLFSGLAAAGPLGGATPTPVAPGTGGTGWIEGGALELSNVDLANEFANLITTQRAFQANARIITTSDEILQELVNLKR